MAEARPDYTGKSRIIVAGPKLSGALKTAIETTLSAAGLVTHVHDFDTNQTGARRQLEHNQDAENLNGNVVAGVVFIERPEINEIGSAYKDISDLAEKMKLPTLDYGSSEVVLERSLAALSAWATGLNVARLEIIEPLRPGIDELGPQAQSA